MAQNSKINSQALHKLVYRFDVAQRNISKFDEKFQNLSSDQSPFPQIVSLSKPSNYMLVLLDQVHIDDQVMEQ